MELVQVDVIGSQASQRRFARPHDVPSRCAPVVAVGPGRQSDLRRQHDVVAAAGACEHLTDDAFALAAGVDVRGVDEVDARVERGEQQLLGRLVVGRAAEVHRPQAQRGHLHAGSSQRSSLDHAANAIHWVPEPVFRRLVAMRVGVFGATGQVGGVMRRLLVERSFPVDEIRYLRLGPVRGPHPAVEGRRDHRRRRRARPTTTASTSRCSPPASTPRRISRRAVAAAGAIVIDNSVGVAHGSRRAARRLRGQSHTSSSTSPRESSPTRTARRWRSWPCSRRCTAKRGSAASS